MRPPFQPGRLDPPPPRSRAWPPGFSEVRYVGDREDGLIGFMDGFQRCGPPDAAEPMRILALSGGGAGGAFGAGALCGLSQVGQRPIFDMVTGVSTGALIAPFAFLGAEWDDRLHAAYVGPETTSLLGLRGLRPGAGLYGAEALQDLVSTFVDQELLDAVAAAHRQGRRLFVATANLDAEQQNIWDLGAIAVLGGEGGLELFRNVLVASATLPGVFAPHLMRVECGGEAFDEMHIDGGAILPLFIVPEPLMLRHARSSRGGVEVYALMNTTLRSTEHATPVGMAAILIRSFELMLRSSYRSALRGVEAFCAINGFQFRAASVPPQVPAVNMLRFDRDHVVALFEQGLGLAAQGDLWSQPSADDLAQQAGHEDSAAMTA